MEVIYLGDEVAIPTRKELSFCRGWQVNRGGEAGARDMRSGAMMGSVMEGSSGHRSQRNTKPTHVIDRVEAHWCERLEREVMV